MKTGSPDLDKHFFYTKTINCIYGKGATGKTNLCHLLAAETARTKKVIYIDTEKGFSPERIEQLSSSKVLRNIIVITANDFNAQHKAVMGLVKMKGFTGLIIIDSLSMHYRKELQEKNPEANSMLSRQFNILSDLCAAGIPVIITCQVYSKLNNDIELIGSNMVRNWSNCLIRLDIEEKRVLRLEKHPEIGQKKIYFRIVNDGIFTD